MLQISADVARLNEFQREALAAFILGFPNEDGTVFTYDDGSTPNAQSPQELTPVAAFGPPAGIVSNLGPTLTLPASTSEALPPAPNAPVPAPPSSGTGANLDKSGLPWDGRIHTSGKALNADGSWRKKRGVSDVLVFEVEKELRSLMAIPSPSPLAPAVAVPNTSGAFATTTDASPSAVSNIPPPPPSNVVAIDEAAMRQQYVTLIGRTSAAIAQRKLTEEQLLKCLNAMGVATLPLLGARLDLVPSVMAMVDGLIAGQSA